LSVLDTSAARRCRGWRLVVVLARRVVLLVVELAAVWRAVVRLAARLVVRVAALPVVLPEAA
jgi:hypothetical protein